MSEEIKQVPRGLSVLIVILISIIVSFCVSFFTYFYIFPQIEKKYLLVRTPDVRNLPVSEAINIISKSNLQYDIIAEEEIENIASGKIISQIPLPKSLVKKNSIVNLVVSKEPSLVKIPDLKSKSIEEAKKILLETGLQIGEIKEVNSSEVEKGNIVYTEPQHGVEVKKNTKINILLSKGTYEVEKVKVPNVVGKTLIEAKKILETQNLSLGNVKKVCDEDKEFDIILSQTPKAGSLVIKGSRINVVINAEEQ
ncbi:MAG: PASTA domain-containing protein [Endomicrobiia bacterium]